MIDAILGTSKPDAPKEKLARPKIDQREKTEIEYENVLKRIKDEDKADIYD